MRDHSNPVPFDPVKGCQKQSTGVLASFFMLALFAFYSIFRTRHFLSDGPKVPFIFSFLPQKFQFNGVNRDYYDILAIIFLGFLFMISWEFVRSAASRCMILLISLAAIFLFGVQCFDVHWFLPEGMSTLAILGLDITQGEIFIALTIGGFLILGLCKIVPFFKKNFHSFSPIGWAVRSAFLRWLSGLIFFALVWLIVFYHPFYQNPFYENWRLTCDHFFVAYLFLGFPYAFITNWIRGKKFENRSDPCFVLYMIGRRLILFPFSRQKDKLRLAITNKRSLSALRDLLVKIFFVPLMVSFVFSEFGGFAQNFTSLVNVEWSVLKHGELFNLFYGTIYHSLFVMDCALAFIGYTSSSRWLGNKSKSVEPTFFGWSIALYCYPPFQVVSSGYLPYNGMGWGPLIFPQIEGIDLALKILTLGLFVIYVWSTMSFGLRFSNLTNRGIITRGPYAWVRHPAYIAKNIAWWTENVYRFWSPWQFVFLAGWNMVYFLRAYTEEKHLNQDADYRDYCLKVRYKFIPGFW